MRRFLSLLWNNLPTVLLWAASACIGWTFSDYKRQLAEANYQAEAAEQQREWSAEQLQQTTATLNDVLKLSAGLISDRDQLQQRLDDISRNATARAVQLEATTHEDEAARSWGDTSLPAAVASLLDYTDQAGTGPVAEDRPSLPSATELPLADNQADNQPDAGAKPDR